MCGGGGERGGRVRKGKGKARPRARRRSDGDNLRERQKQRKATEQCKEPSGGRREEQKLQYSLQVGINMYSNKTKQK